MEGHAKGRWCESEMCSLCYSSPMQKRISALRKWVEELKQTLAAKDAEIERLRNAANASIAESADLAASATRELETANELLRKARDRWTYPGETGDLCSRIDAHLAAMREKIGGE